MELIELKVGQIWERGAEVGSVATRYPASGLLGVGAGRAYAPNKAPGRMHEVMFNRTWPDYWSVDCPAVDLIS